MSCSITNSYAQFLKLLQGSCDAAQWLKIFYEGNLYCQKKFQIGTWILQHQLFYGQNEKIPLGPWGLRQLQLQTDSLCLSILYHLPLRFKIFPNCSFHLNSVNYNLQKMVTWCACDHFTIKKYFNNNTCTVLEHFLSTMVNRIEIERSIWKILKPQESTIQN